MDTLLFMLESLVRPWYVRPTDTRECPPFTVPRGVIMIPRLMLSALALAALVLLTPADAFAGKVPGMRTSGMRDPGVRGDQSVPYLTSGNSAFFTSYVGVEIYHMPQMDNRQF